MRALYAVISVTCSTGHFKIHTAALTLPAPPDYPRRAEATQRVPEDGKPSLRYLTLLREGARAYGLCFWLAFVGSGWLLVDGPQCKILNELTEEAMTDLG